MNGKWAPALLALALTIGLPRLVFGIWTMASEPNVLPTEPFVSTESFESIKINLITEKGIREIDLEEYLVGVLLLEIPEDFHIEAQKAQAVVARTYALRTTRFKEKHQNNGICVDPGCCQGYRDPAKYLVSGGSEARVTLAKQAVGQTTGQVLTYQNLPIDATYFSCSGGQTEDAVAVWGVDVPYLQSVSSPGEEISTHYRDDIRFTPDEFQMALGQALPGSPINWVGEITYTRGGGVEHIRIGGKLYTGTQLRTLLGLRSTAFTISASNEIISITTKGFGHRVGMSQYGAQAMALNGKEYTDILTHYYPGTVIDKEGFIG